MEPVNVVVLQNDSRVAKELFASLQIHFNFMYLAKTLEEVREAIPRYRAAVAVLDMELASRTEVEKLRREFPGVALVCTHRLADEEMWKDAVQAGASDLCFSADSHGIVTAALRSTRATRSMAA
jgi:DNA-binding NarL/FixJ family response regulator